MFYDFTHPLMVDNFTTALAIVTPLKAGILRDKTMHDIMIQIIIINKILCRLKLWWKGTLV